MHEEQYLLQHQGLIQEQVNYLLISSITSILIKQGFTPIGRVIEGMETVVDHLYYHYGEGGQGDGADGKGPSQGRLNLEGKKYLDKTFPKLSYIKYATVLEGYHPEGGSS